MGLYYCLVKPDKKERYNLFGRKGNSYFDQKFFTKHPAYGEGSVKFKIEDIEKSEVTGNILNHIIPSDVLSSGSIFEWIDNCYESIKSWCDDDEVIWCDEETFYDLFENVDIVLTKSAYKNDNIGYVFERYTPKPKPTLIQVIYREIVFRLRRFIFLWNHGYSKEFNLDSNPRISWNESNTRKFTTIDRIKYPEVTPKNPYED